MENGSREEDGLGAATPRKERGRERRERIGWTL